MSSTKISPRNFEESLIWYSMLGTYALYFIGVQYIYFPMLGWFLAFLTVKRWVEQSPKTSPTERTDISWIFWIWIAAVLVIEIALVVGHVNFNLGTSQIIKSSLVWTRTWALFAVFPLAGCLNIRPQLIYRAACILCLQSLLVITIGTLAKIAGLPDVMFVSPFEIIGGGSMQYEVHLFHSIVGQRLELFTVFPTALGLVGNIFFCFALNEKDVKWKWIGLITSVSMTIFSVSRAAILCLPLVPILVPILMHLVNPWMQIIAGSLSFLSSLLLPRIVAFLQELKDSFDSVRSGSSEVRYGIYRMSIERWQNEAPVWGFGMREPTGPRNIARMPLGTHHTWIGLLYTHGLVGCVAFGIAFSLSFINVLFKAKNSETARVGLSILLYVLFATFVDSIEFFTYSLWPALIVLGVALKERVHEDGSVSNLQNTLLTSEGYDF